MWTETYLASRSPGLEPCTEGDRRGARHGGTPWCTTCSVEEDVPGTRHHRGATATVDGPRRRHVELTHWPDYFDMPAARCGGPSGQPHHYRRHRPRPATRSRPARRDLAQLARRPVAPGSGTDFPRRGWWSASTRAVLGLVGGVQERAQHSGCRPRERDARHHIDTLYRGWPAVRCRLAIGAGARSGPTVAHTATIDWQRIPIWSG
jgi:hypothetical protein